MRFLEKLKSIHTARNIVILAVGALLISIGVLLFNSGVPKLNYLAGNLGNCQAKARKIDSNEEKLDYCRQEFKLIDGHLVSKVYYFYDLGSVAPLDTIMVAGPVNCKADSSSHPAACALQGYIDMAGNSAVLAADTSTAGLDAFKSIGCDSTYQETVNFSTSPSIGSSRIAYTRHTFWNQTTVNHVSIPAAYGSCIVTGKTLENAKTTLFDLKAVYTYNADACADKIPNRGTSDAAFGCISQLSLAKHDIKVCSMLKQKRFSDTIEYNYFHDPVEACEYEYATATDNSKVCSLLPSAKSIQSERYAYAYSSEDCQLAISDTDNGHKTLIHL